MTQPLTDNQIWGLDQYQEEYACPLLDEDGNCPQGCNECEIFALEIQGLATENTEVTEK